MASRGRPKLSDDELLHPRKVFQEQLCMSLKHKDKQIRQLQNEILEIISSMEEE